jgi:hypothetical protein
LPPAVSGIVIDPSISRILTKTVTFRLNDPINYAVVHFLAQILQPSFSELHSEIFPHLLAKTWEMRSAAQLNSHLRHVI